MCLGVRHAEYVPLSGEFSHWIASAAGLDFRAAGCYRNCNMPCPNRDVVHNPEAMRAISRSHIRWSAAVTLPGKLRSKAIPL